MLGDGCGEDVSKSEENGGVDTCFTIYGIPLQCKMKGLDSFFTFVGTILKDRVIILLSQLGSNLGSRRNSLRETVRCTRIGKYCRTLRTENCGQLRIEWIILYKIHSISEVGSKII